MAARGFTVCQIHLSKETHEVVSVWYAYHPDDAAEWLAMVTGGDGGASITVAHSNSSRASA